VYGNKRILEEFNEEENWAAAEAVTTPCVKRLKE
jgi:hypothetical protein